MNVQTVEINPRLHLLVINGEPHAVLSESIDTADGHGHTVIITGRNINVTKTERGETFPRIALLDMIGPPIEVPAYEDGSVPTPDETVAILRQRLEDRR